MVPAGIYMFKVNNRNTRTRCELCSKLTIKIPARRHWHLYCWISTYFTSCSSTSIVYFEQGIKCIPYTYFYSILMQLIWRHYFNGYKIIHIACGAITFYSFIILQREQLKILLQQRFLKNHLGHLFPKVDEAFPFMCAWLFKNTHREKARSNKTSALKESTNMDTWVVGTSNQLYIRDSETETKF